MFDYINFFLSRLFANAGFLSSVKEIIIIGSGSSVNAKINEISSKAESVKTLTFNKAIIHLPVSIKIDIYLYEGSRNRNELYQVINSLKSRKNTLVYIKLLPFLYRMPFRCYFSAAIWRFVFSSRKLFVIHRNRALNNDKVYFQSKGTMSLILETLIESKSIESIRIIGLDLVGHYFWEKPRKNKSIHLTAKNGGIKILLNKLDILDNKLSNNNACVQIYSVNELLQSKYNTW
jgi:hypothetical protein